ncbi:hypothetical protein [Streptomyces noursei]|uniref:hypothetical protein n=1 Tax=Streptomyces noursei TaxID=1971 RepID=UPI001671E422|nr:hypothetical protein [Streptomyces noursei]MCZ1021356.1 hypothetical protein [Streptomyces noursei]GGX51918.1 hypothetical protein GCM10010341_86740 [Streptomyces noursei]
MPYIYLQLSQNDRVERPTSSAQVTRGTVTHAIWESVSGARYFILWDGSAIARRYTTEQLQDQHIYKVSKTVETGDNGRAGR